MESVTSQPVSTRPRWMFEDGNVICPREQESFAADHPPEVVLHTVVLQGQVLCTVVVTV